jgi:hypothetical protein
VLSMPCCDAGDSGLFSFHTIGKDHRSASWEHSLFCHYHAVEFSCPPTFLFTLVSGSFEAHDLEPLWKFLSADPLFQSALHWKAEFVLRLHKLNRRGLP